MLERCLKLAVWFSALGFIFKTSGNEGDTCHFDELILCDQLNASSAYFR